MIDITYFFLLWQPPTGDTTLMGWLAVFFYLAAAVLSAACAWQASRIFPGKGAWIHRLLWGSLAAVLLFLAINKQLDLQSWLTQAGRELAIRQGWYEMRQEVQIRTIAGMIGGSAVMGTFLVWVFRHYWKYYWPALAGLLFLARYIIVRAATFWGVPLLQLSRWTGGLRINWLLEILGASLICLSAVLFLKPGKKPISPSGVFSPSAGIQ